MQIFDMYRGNKAEALFIENYNKLKEIIDFEAIPEWEMIKLTSSSFMDLVIEHLSWDIFSITHYGEMNWDLMKDPDMTFRLGDWYDDKYIFALSFQNDYMGVYQEVDKDSRDNDNLNLIQKLNDFLKFWLGNIKDQGYEIKSKYKDNYEKWLNSQKL